MEPEVINLLIDLNKQFYQTFALQFAAKRQKVQPGVQRLLGTLPREARVLDIGCGNGVVARELLTRGFKGIYVGLEINPAFLEMARATLAGYPGFIFLEGDLASPDWVRDLREEKFDVVFAFAILHHLPGKHLRLSILTRVRQLLSKSGRLAISVWQFLNSPRLRARLQPWEKVGLSPDQVELGDYLLDWREGGVGLRYVHHFNPDELASLALECGYQVLDTFSSDGEGGVLGLYQIWQQKD